MKLNTRKTIQDCLVVKIPSNIKVQKTIVVSITKKLLNSKYKRHYTNTYTRLVHYEEDSPLQKGDKVTIHECRRISAHKSAICYGKKL